MRVSEAMIGLIREQLSNGALKKDEIRRIEGMGDLFMTLGDSPTSAPEGYRFLYSLKIDEVDYSFLSRKSNG